MVVFVWWCDNGRFMWWWFEIMLMWWWYAGDDNDMEYDSSAIFVFVSKGANIWNTFLTIS